jgi:RNA polymerase sigma factor (sigma-70 family)
MIELKEEHKRLVTILARKYSSARVSEEDLFQEGCLALIKAQKTFQEGKGVRFEGYACVVIKNRMIDVLRKHGNQDSEFIEDLSASEFNIENEVGLHEIKKSLEAINEIDRAIFNAFIQGFSYDEMGKIFELSKKKIDNTIQKVKRKVRENCKE